MLFLHVIISLVLGPWELAPPTAEDPAAVVALLKARCGACHGEDAKSIKGGLDLRTRESSLRGGDSGEPAIVPGDPGASLLHIAVTWDDVELRMPPKANDRLSTEEVAQIKRWIEQGAKWPVAVSTAPKAAAWSDPKEGSTIATSGGQSPEWTNRKYLPEDVWAFQPARRQMVPKFDGAPDLHPIDAFLRAKMETKGLAPAPLADKRTLFRRTTMDLTGLPPTAEETAAFLADPAADAHDRLVERLLASPHHGEQMARRWLDVVRYADTSGFSNDFERPNAWRYRDYVVRRFNQDVPFDRFITEQLAGDELAPDDPEMLVAVGFLRMGPWEHTGMSVAAVTRQQFLDDVTNSVGVTFLGQGLRCASCHDHKFDPIPTRDYYRLQAVFAPVQFADRDAAWLPEESRPGPDDGREQVERLLADAKAFLDGLREKNEAAVAAELAARGVAKLADLPAGQRPDKRFGLSSLDMSLQKIYEKRVAYFERSRLRYAPIAFSVYDGPQAAQQGPQAPRALMPPEAKRRGPAAPVHVLRGGALDSPGDEVRPGVLSALPGSHDGLEATAWNTVPDDLNGRRLALARWVASDRNSLTARVIVNRVWQWHFGRGIVATPNNFGKMGRRPSHPELLDWLATWFVEHGWSLKKLHRLIVTSEAYRRSGDHPDAARVREVDPNNELLMSYPPRRLDAEEIRDGMLAITGELNRDVGGPPVFPELNWDVALQPRHIMGSVAPAYQPSPRPEQRNRRTLYAFRSRTLSDPMLDVFDRPGTEVSCPVRDETTVTPQVFALFNSQVVHDRALALALRVEKEADTAEARVQRAVRHVHGREAAATELARCLSHVQDMAKHHREHPAEPVPLTTMVRRKMVEELTGEEFSWDEELELMKDYQRDRRPWDVGPETRALADLCLVLFNSNEFLYLR